MNDQQNQFMTGARRSKFDRRDKKIASIQAPVDLPSEFRLEDNFPVKNQNGYGSCLGQGTAGHKQHQEYIEISARKIYAECKKIDNYSGQGTYGRIAFKVLCDIGACEEKLFPEEHDSYEKYIDLNLQTEEAKKNALEHKSQSYWRMDDVEEIKQTIYQKKMPVTFLVPWYGNYNRPDENGYLPEPKGKGEGHAILCLGWKDGWLLVKNSWGKNWGKDGYCWFREDYLMWEGWCSLDMPKNLPVDNRYGEKRTWKKFIMEQAWAFNPWLIKKIGRLPNNREIKAGVFGFWSYEEIFKGVVGTKWLFCTKPAYQKGLCEGGEKNG
jgi:hypothetical protein